MSKKSTYIFLTLIASGGGLYLALRGVEDFGAIGVALRRADWGLVFLAILLMLGVLVLRALRWRLLLDRRVSLPTAFGLINLGYLLSGILPLRLGDPARAVAAGLRSSVSPVMALSTVVVERTLDLLTISFLAVLTLPFVSGLGTTETKGIVAGGLAAAALVVLLWMAHAPGQVEGLARKVLERLPLGAPERWLRPLRSILEGLQALRSPRRGAQLAALSAGIWGVNVVYYVVLARALEIRTPAPLLLVATTVTWATALGMAAPTPGGIGGFHVAVQVVLTLAFGVGADRAATYGLLSHAIAYLLGIVLGSGAMFAWGLSLRTLSERAQVTTADSSFST